jgi:gamma-glutamylcyclotransferase
MTSFAYAAYGSNLHPVRLCASDRCPSAKLRGTCVLTGWHLLFRKRSTDKSAKCDAERTDNPLDKLLVAVFDISTSEERALDDAEGLGKGYREDSVDLTINGQRLAAKIYLADKDAIVIDEPYEWYKQMVLLGAEYHRYPGDYIDAIRIVASKPDPDPTRSQKNWCEVEKMKAANQALQVSQNNRWE